MQNAILLEKWQFLKLIFPMKQPPFLNSHSTNQCYPQVHSPCCVNMDMMSDLSEITMSIIANCS